MNRSFSSLITCLSSSYLQLKHTGVPECQWLPGGQSSCSTWLFSGGLVAVKRMLLEDLQLWTCHWTRVPAAVIWNRWAHLYRGHASHGCFWSMTEVGRSIETVLLLGEAGLLWWTTLAQGTAEDLVKSSLESMVVQNASTEPLFSLSISVNWLASLSDVPILFHSQKLAPSGLKT